MPGSRRWRFASARPRSASATSSELPPVIDDLARLPNGLILITGATGNGKTTTLNYLVNLINRSRRVKIVTIEDPVEYVHRNQSSIVVQQEVYTDVPSFRQALTHVLRQDPDVVVIGEMRDLETIATALTAAETGHLVIATLHTPDAVQTIQRIFSVFPHEQQNAITYQLSNTLQAVLAQRLLPRADNKGLVLATEVCIATPAVRKRIRDGEPHLLFSDMQMGRKHQMQTLDASLLELYQRGEIGYDVAISNAREPESIRQRSSRHPRRNARPMIAVTGGTSASSRTSGRVRQGTCTIRRSHPGLASAGPDPCGGWLPSRIRAVS